MNSLRVVLRVLRDRELRRVEIGLVAFAICETATWLAITVFAYDRGGVGEAGVVSALQLVPAAIAAPFISVAADRLPRSRVLAVGFGLQAIAFGLAAVAMLADMPIALIYGSAILAAISVTFTRPAVGAVIPSLVASPVELTAANVAASFAEGIGTFLGPAMGGIMLIRFHPGTVFATSGLLMAVMCATTIGLRLQPGQGDVHPDDAAESPAAGLVAGVNLLRKDRDIRLLVALLSISFVVIGALDIAVVVVAIELLGRTEASAGLFSAAAGLGGVIGAAASVGLVGRSRLTRPIAWGVGLAGVSLAGVAAGGSLGVSPSFSQSEVWGSRWRTSQAEQCFRAWRPTMSSLACSAFWRASRWAGWRSADWRSRR